MTDFVISDLHFGHDNTWKKFTRPDGSPLRNFQSSEEMDEHIIKQWNDTVKGHDRVFLLGDVVINKKHLWKMSRLNGSIYLVMGNHDVAPIEEYAQYCTRIYGALEYGKFILTHYPIHPQQKYRFEGNIHGHMHFGQLDDPWYFNVSVENLDYTPRPIQQVMQHIQKATGNVSKRT